LVKSIYFYLFIEQQIKTVAPDLVFRHPQYVFVLQTSGIEETLLTSHPLMSSHYVPYVYTE